MHHKETVIVPCLSISKWDRLWKLSKSSIEDQAIRTGCQCGIKPLWVAGRNLFEEIMSGGGHCHQTFKTAYLASGPFFILLLLFCLRLQWKSIAPICLESKERASWSDTVREQKHL